MWCCFKKPTPKPPVEVELPRYESEAEAVRHGFLRTSHYTVYYPAHKERSYSPIYAKTHAQMKHLPCFICGKTNEQDGIHVETHHFFCEKALQNAYDWKRFGEFAQTCYVRGECIGPLFDWDQVALNSDLFVDSPYNMMVLCKEHHTSAGRGIHHVPFPEWIAQKFAIYEVLGKVANL